jgi:hypothetical protein
MGVFGAPSCVILCAKTDLLYGDCPGAARLLAPALGVAAVGKPPCGYDAGGLAGEVAGRPAGRNVTETVSSLGEAVTDSNRRKAADPLK